MIRLIATLFLVIVLSPVFSQEKAPKLSWDSIPMLGDKDFQAKTDGFRKRWGGKQISVDCKIEQARTDDEGVVYSWVNAIKGRKGFGGITLPIKIKAVFVDISEKEVREQERKSVSIVGTVRKEGKKGEPVTIEVRGK